MTVVHNPRRWRSGWSESLCYFVLQDHHAFAKAELKGLIPRSFYYLFYLMHKNPNAGYRLTASYLEIYNEQVKYLQSLDIWWQRF